MRTTLDIADDVLLAAKESARRKKTSVGAVISELARRSLLRADEPAAQMASGEVAPHRLHDLGIRPLPRRGGLLSNEVVNQLREDGGY